MPMTLKQKEFLKTDKGWHRIAWAFLKVSKLWQIWYDGVFFRKFFSIKER